MSRGERIHGPSVVSRRNMRAREVNRHHLDVEKQNDGRNLLSKYTSDQGLQTELNWTGGDALKLATSVLNKLRAYDPLGALEMVRLSEKLPGAEGKKGVESVVSWNHIMDYYMSKSLTREAFKVFNEVSAARL
jgi:pentatricopeptide repeat protein